jgi:hypothetical protein
MKTTSLSTLALCSSFLGLSAYSYPLLSTGAGAGTGPEGQVVMIYRDHQTPGLYWYIPTGIEPAANSDGRFNRPVVRPNYFSFSFRGQISASEEAVKSFATAHHLNRDQIIPIPFDYSRNVYCQNVDENAGVKIDHPHTIGNYAEYVPVTVFTSNPEMVPILQEKIDQAGGINCSVDVGFKAVVDSYAIHYVADMKTIYERFEASLHGSAFIFEVDIHTLLESLRREGYIKITKLSDQSVLTSEDQSDRAKAAFEGVMDIIVKAMFERVTRLPDGPMAAREKSFSLRADFRRNSEYLHFEGDYEEQGVVTKESAISIRVGRGGV